MTPFGNARRAMPARNASAKHVELLARRSALTGTIAIRSAFENKTACQGHGAIRAVRSSGRLAGARHLRR
jgi:hypothetical protein